MRAMALGRHDFVCDLSREYDCIEDRYEGYVCHRLPILAMLMCDIWKHQHKWVFPVAK